MEMMMYASKIEKRYEFRLGRKNFVFGSGDFFLSVTLKEIAEVEKKGGLVERIMREVFSHAIVKRDERGFGEQALWVGYFRAEVPGWTAVFNAAVAHRQRLTVRQFVALAQIIRAENFNLKGDHAHCVISELYGMTPGGNQRGARGFPRATSEELEVFRLKKFRDSKFGNQTSLHFVLPEGDMFSRLFGSDSRNKDHLDQMLTGVAGIHTWIKGVEIDQLEPEAISV